MHHFKAADDTLHCLSDEDIANGGMSLIPPGCVEITSAQADALRDVPPAPAVPQSVTPVQAFTALDQVGKLAPLMAYLDTPDTPPLVRAVVMGATEWRRDSLLLMSVAIVLGLSPAEVDHLFVNASEISL